MFWPFKKKIVQQQTEPMLTVLPEFPVEFEQVRDRYQIRVTGRPGGFRVWCRAWDRPDDYSICYSRLEADMTEEVCEEYIRYNLVRSYQWWLKEQIRINAVPREYP
jgi:hypothetical protein